MYRVASLILSIYLTAFLYANVFFIKQLTIASSGNQLFWNHLAIFLILLIPIYLLLNKLVSLPYTRGVLRPIRSILLFVALAGVVVSIFYHIIPLEPIYDLPNQIDTLFASDLAFTIWLVVPLLVLFI